MCSSPSTPFPHLSKHSKESPDENLPWTLLPAFEKESSVTAENHGVNGLRTINMLHWTRNDIPFRILPSQYAKRRRCTNNIQECLCARHKAETWQLQEKMRMPQSWLRNVFAERKTRHARVRQIGFLRRGSSHHPLGRPLIVDHRNHSNGEKKPWRRSFCVARRRTWRRSFIPLSRLISPRTRPRTIPLKRRRRRWVWLLLLLHGVSPDFLLFLIAFDDTLYCQIILDVLLYQQNDVRALLNCQPSPMHLFTEMDVIVGILHGHRILFSCKHPNFVILSIQVCFIFCPTINASFEKKSSVWWLGRRLLCASQDMDTQLSPTYLTCWCAMALAPSDLFGKSKLYWWLNGHLFQLYLERSLLERLSNRQKLLSTHAKIVPNLFLFGTTNTMNVDFAAFVFCDDLCCAGDCSTVKIQRHLVLCHAKKLPSAVHGRID